MRGELVGRRAQHHELGDIDDQRRGWRTADKKPVKNEDLWRQLDEVRSKHEVEWRWVKGHAGHPENERADALANKGIPVETDRP